MSKSYDLSYFYLNIPVVITNTCSYNLLALQLKGLVVEQPFQWNKILTFWIYRQMISINTSYRKGFCQQSGILSVIRKISIVDEPSKIKSIKNFRQRS